MSGLSLPFLQLHGQNTLVAAPFVLTLVPLLFVTGAILPLLIAVLIAVAVNVVFQCCINRLAPVSAREAVLVTGASCGLGEATALRMARSGYTVFAAVRKAEDGDALKEKAGSAASRLSPLVLDLLQQQSVDAAVATVQRQLDADGGGWLMFRALINVVGPMTVVGAIEVCSPEQFESSYAVSVAGTVRVTQAFLPLLRATAARGERARLLFTSSISGAIMTVPYLALHGANKAALEEVANACRMELRGFGVDVSIITPGNMSNVERKNHIIERLTPHVQQLTARFPRVEADVLAEYDGRLRGMFSHMRGMSTEPVDSAAVASEYAVRVWLPDVRYLCSWDGTMATGMMARMPEMLRDRMFLSMAKTK